MEYKKKGIIVQSLNPYFVSTKMSGMRGSMMSPMPLKFVSDALGTVGTQPVTNGCVAHNIQVKLIEKLWGIFSYTHLWNCSSFIKGLGFGVIAKIFSWSHNNEHDGDC